MPLGKFVVVKSLSCVLLFAIPWTAACQTSLSFTVFGVYSNSCPLSWWCHPSISPFVAPFSSCPQSFQPSGTFSVSQFFTLGRQSTGASASVSVLLMNIQGWFPLGLPGLISLMSKGLSRVFSSTPVWKHQFFGAQPSLRSNSHILRQISKTPDFDSTASMTIDLCVCVCVCVCVRNFSDDTTSILQPQVKKMAQKVF